MRKGKTIRISEDLCEIIKDLTQIYKHHYNIQRVNQTNIMEKLVINGFPSYIADLKEREKQEPNITIAKQIQGIETKLHEYMQSMGQESGSTKILSFVTEEQLHGCIEELAIEEARVLQQNIGYTSLVTGMIVKGADFYINLIEQFMSPNEVNKIKSIKEYIDGLEVKLDTLIKEDVNSEIKQIQCNWGKSKVSYNKNDEQKKLAENVR